MIYLFCNETYGKAFLETAKQYSAMNQVAITVVFSSKRKFSNHVLKAPLSRLKWFLKQQYKARLATKEHRVPVLIVTDINAQSFQRRIQATDHGIISGFNQIFKAPLIERFQSLVNFHPSILPFYRGPVPSYWCIKNGEEKTGYTLHRVTEAIDQGEILFQEVLTIDAISQPEVLDQKIAQQAAKILWQYLDTLRTGSDWNSTTLETADVYKVPVDYVSFPTQAYNSSRSRLETSKRN